MTGRKVKDQPGSEAARLAEIRAEARGLIKDLTGVVKEARGVLAELDEKCTALRMSVVDASNSKADDLIEVALAGRVGHLAHVIDTQVSRALDVMRVRFDELYRTMEGEMRNGLGIDVERLARMVGARRRTESQGVPAEAQVQQALHIGVRVLNNLDTPP